MRIVLHRLRKRAATAVGTLADIALFVGIVLIGGLGSSWYMVEAGSTLTTRSVGPWVTWTNAARSDADPYTRAHFARAGTLPLSSDVSETYLATSDSDGKRLYSSCEYAVEGEDIAASWWSLTIFDDRGRLIPNPLQRYGFTSDTIALGPNGNFTITLSRDARPGNWVPTGGAGRLALLLTAIDTRETGIISGSAREPDLPRIRRIQCR